MKIPRLILCGALALVSLCIPAQAEPPEWSGSPDRHIVIKTLLGQMRYDLAEVIVEPGDRVKLTLQNDDDLQHNLLLISPSGKDPMGIEFAKEVWLMAEEGMKKGWVPDNHDRLLVASSLLNPHQTEDIYFVAPEKQGAYPYVCTVPGHAMIMNGKLRVRPRPQPLQDLEWKLYEGDWNKLPDFSKLEVKATGKVEDGLMDPKVVDKNGKYGLVFTGNLQLKQAGNYEFFLTSDDGSRLVIDGETVVAHDGVHPAGQIQKKKVKLQEGDHSFELRYFDKGGHKDLSLVINGPGLKMIPLTTWVAKGKAQTPAPDPILLAAENPGEAVMYRNFIAGVSPRGIGVGYPGGINVAWDADVLNLALVWRGAFMDASRHWTNRGQGNQPPGGFDVVTPGAGLPLQVLESMDEPWVAESLDQIAYDRDKPPAERSTMRTLRVPHPDYQFKGYALDEKRFPTFRYEFQDLAVTDRLDPTEIEGIEAVKRTVSISGDAKEGTWFRLATGLKADAEGGWYALGDTLRMKVEGAEPILRPGEKDQELLLPIGGATSFTVTYAWTEPIGGQVQASIEGQGAILCGVTVSVNF